MNEHVLTAEQEAALEAMLSPHADGGALNASDGGTGKTLMTVEFLRRSGVTSALIVAPLQTHDGWITTLATQGVDVPVRVMNSTKAGREAFTAWSWRQPGIYLINRELFERRAWIAQKRTDRHGKEHSHKVDSGMWSSWDIDAFVFDEVHQASNVQAWINKALMKVTAKFKMGLSATFAGNNFDGAYGATRWIWPHRAERNIYEFRARWALTEYDRFAPRNQRTVGERVEGAFVASLPCYVRLEQEFDIVEAADPDNPEPIHHDVRIDLYPEQYEVIEQLERKMVAWIKDNPLITELPITKRIRQRQSALAMPTPVWDGDDLVDVVFEDDAPSAKIDKLIKMLDNELAGEPVLVVSDSKRFVKLLVNRLNEHFGTEIAAGWHGDVSHPRRAEIKARFLQGEIRVLVGQITAMGTGTDGLQQVCHHLVMMNRAESRIDNEQVVWRLYRRGQTKQVYVWHLLANRTKDTDEQLSDIEEALAMNRSMRR